MKNNLISVSGKLGSGKDTVGQIIQYLTSGYNDGHHTYEQYLIDVKKRNDYPEFHKFKIKKYADKLKDIACLLIGCTREQLEDREFKEKELGEEWWYYKRLGKLESYLEHKHFNYKAIELVKLTPRKLLQLLGTECGRNIIHPNIWVNSLFADYKNILTKPTQSYYSEKANNPIGIANTVPEYGKPNWIITDMRFPNELKAVKDRGGITIRVNRWIKENITKEEARMLFNSGLESVFGINDEGNESEIFELSDIDRYSKWATELDMSMHPSETALDDAEFDYVIDNNGAIEELIEKVKEILIKIEVL